MTLSEFPDISSFPEIPEKWQPHKMQHTNNILIPVLHGTRLAWPTLYWVGC